MHRTSALRMTEFVKKYLPRDKKLSVLDVGSMDVNNTWTYDFCRSYRELFINKNWTYKGLDIAKGKNVDIREIGRKLNVLTPGILKMHMM